MVQKRKKFGGGKAHIWWKNAKYFVEQTQNIGVKNTKKLV